MATPLRARPRLQRSACTPQACLICVVAKPMTLISRPVGSRGGWGDEAQVRRAGSGAAPGAKRSAPSCVCSRWRPPLPRPHRMSTRSHARWPLAQPGQACSWRCSAAVRAAVAAGAAMRRRCASRLSRSPRSGSRPTRAATAAAPPAAAGGRAPAAAAGAAAAARRQAGTSSRVARRLPLGLNQQSSGSSKAAKAARTSSRSSRSTTAPRCVPRSRRSSFTAPGSRR